MDMYREHILDHYRHPRGWGVLPQADIEQEVVNESCGDRLVVQMNIKDHRLTDFRFTGHGCAISIAAASVLGEALPSYSIEETMALTFVDMQQLLGIDISARRMNCALLALTAVKQGLKSRA